MCLLTLSSRRLSFKFNAKGAGKLRMSSATFAAGVTAAFAAYYREQDMLEEHAKGVTEHARLTKELTDELGRSNGPPRLEDRSEVPGERSEVPRHRGRDDDYDQQFPTHASSQVRRVTS